MKKEDKKPAKKDDDWMTRKWRPMMAIMYMFCCLADFFLFPIMFTVVQFWEMQAANDAFRQWVPITLQGGGLFHVAMGAVLGVSAYGRTQEKLNGATGGVPTPTLSSAPPAPQPTGFATPAPTTNSWGSQPLGSGSSLGSAPQTAAYQAAPSWGTTPTASAEVITGFGGKPAPVIPPYPEK